MQPFGLQHHLASKHSSLFAAAYEQHNRLELRRARAVELFEVTYSQLALVPWSGRTSTLSTPVSRAPVACWRGCVGLCGAPLVIA